MAENHTHPTTDIQCMLNLQLLRVSVIRNGFLKGGMCTRGKTLIKLVTLSSPDFAKSFLTLEAALTSAGSGLSTPSEGVNPTLTKETIMAPSFEAIAM